MKVCIHRGAHEIGGSCVELEAGGRRLLLDLGLPLDAEAATPGLLPAVPGLREPSGDLLGVVVSHAHMDHCQLLSQARPDLPVAMGAAARRILAAAAPWTPDGLSPAPGPVLEDGRPFEWGPFRITPHRVDHSAFDAYALLVEAEGRKVLYSGDFRAHGRTAWRFDRLIRALPRDIDALLMEGSSLGRLGPDDGFMTESALEDQLVEGFRDTPGMALACASAQNIDRIVTLFRAARRSGRDLLIDLYTAAILEATGHPGIPQSHWRGVRLYVPSRQKRQIVRGGHFALLDRHRRHRIFPERLGEAASRSVLLFRQAHRADLEASRALEGARIFHSLWEGYLEQDAGRDLRAWAQGRGIPVRQVHTSGHASPRDLRRFAEAVDPGVLVPIHSFHPGMYPDLFPRVRPCPDGERWMPGT